MSHFQLSVSRDRSVPRAGVAWLWFVFGILLPFASQGQPAGDAPQRLIVRLAGDASSADVPDAAGLERRTRDVLRAADVPGLAFERQLGPSVVTIRFVEAVPEAVVERAIERLRGQPGVVYAEADRRVRPHLVPYDPAYLAQQWNLWDTYGIRAPEAWDQERGDAGLVIAVLDTGILRHADLDPARVLQGRDFVTEPRYSNDGDGWDTDPSDPGDAVTAGTCPDGGPAEDQNSSWHGLHLAGVVLAATDNGVGIAGINHASRLLPVRVLGKCGGSFGDIIPAILWSAGLPVAGIEINPTPAKVINMSFGALGACTTDTAVQYAIDQAVAAGAVVVVAAGNNDGTDVAKVVPAGCNNVITVAATDHGGAVPAYSNIGARVLLSAPGGGWPYGIYSLSNTGTAGPVPSPIGDTYASIIGTSLATAQVSAAVSLMLSAQPALGLADIRTLLQQSAQPYPAGGCLSGLCGAGILDAAEAVRLAGTAATTGTPVVTSSGGGGGGGCTLRGGASPERDIALWLVLLGLGALWTRRGRNGSENALQPRKHTDVHGR